MKPEDEEPERSGKKSRNGRLEQIVGHEKSPKDGKRRAHPIWGMVHPARNGGRVRGLPVDGTFQGVPIVRHSFNAERARL